ncbi:MAG: cell division protein ZapA [Bacteroidales bacterium]|nr:cell division protein ZapA [Bacteroidales bacterium]MBR4918573.1 cell division protein ZapA [Bacteroidales bacterium]
MENDRIKITIQVAQRPMTITIQKEWEHYFREAEKIINDSFLEFAKKWTYTDQQDLLSKILVDFVVKWLADEERLKGFDEEVVPMMESLKELTDKFEVD